MPYMNVDLNYFDHPKTKRLVALLGPGSDVLPLRLWAYCGRVHAKDGRMQRYEWSEVEAAIGWTGKPKAAVNALVKVGFILVSSRAYQCVDWAQHQGHIQAFSRRGKENAKKRWSSYATSNATSNAKNKSGNAPAVPALPAVPDLTSRTKPYPPNQADVRNGKATWDDQTKGKAHSLYSKVCALKGKSQSEAERDKFMSDLVATIRICEGIGKDPEAFAMQAKLKFTAKGMKDWWIPLLHAEADIAATEADYAKHEVVKKDYNNAPRESSLPS